MPPNPWTMTLLIPAGLPAFPGIETVSAIIAANPLLQAQRLPDAGQILQEALEREDIQIRTGGLRAQDRALTQTDPPDQPLQEPPDLQETGISIAAALPTELHGNNPTETDHKKTGSVFLPILLFFNHV